MRSGNLVGWQDGWTRVPAPIEAGLVRNHYGVCERGLVELGIWHRWARVERHPSPRPDVAAAAADRAPSPAKVVQYLEVHSPWRYLG